MDLSDEQIRGLSREQLLEQFFLMKDEFNEYQTSSSEMEKIMDAENEDLKKHKKRLEIQYQQAILDQKRTKERQEESRTQWIQVEEQLRRENGQLRELCERQKERIRKLEQTNDVLERSDRNKEFMASDLGTKLDNAIEKIAMLESELYERQIASDEAYRLKEDSRVTERPRLIVEPLRKEQQKEMSSPDDPMSPGPSKDFVQNIDNDVCMEDVDADHKPDPMDESMAHQMEGVQIGNDSQVVEEKNRKAPTGAGACVSRIVKDLMTKVERLETLLSTIRVSGS